MDDGFSTALLDEIHAAFDIAGEDPSTHQPNYVNAVLSVIDDYADVLLQGSSGDHFRELPDNGTRQAAIAKGLREVKELFGDYSSNSVISSELARQIDTEYAKHLFTTALDSATTSTEVVQALEAHVITLYNDRQSLIVNWSSVPDNEAVAIRVAELQSDQYTTVLSEVASRLDDPAFIADVAARLLAARNGMEDKRFFDIDVLIEAMDVAADASDGAIVDELNATTEENALLAAIESHATTLLTSQNAEHFNEMPVGSDARKAIAQGLNEFKILFEPFDTIGSLKTALNQLIESEYPKYMFMAAVDSAATVEDMIIVLMTYVGSLSDERQALIAQWDAIENNSALEIRVEELKHETYTIILKSIADHLYDPEFVEEIATRLLMARHEQANDTFLHISDVIDAMDPAVNVPPTAPESQNFSLDEDTSLDAIAIQASDANGDALIYSIKDEAQPQKGTVSFHEGKFTYVPGDDATGSDSFIIVVSDGKGGMAEQTIHITIKPVNDAPVASSNDNFLTGIEDVPLTGQVPEGSDIDGDALSYELVAPVDGLTFNPDGSFLYTPPLNFHGIKTFQYRAVDPTGAKSEAQTFTLTLSSLNDAPVAAASGNSVSGNEDTPISGKVPAGSDPDGDVLSYELVDDVPGLRFNPDGTFTYKPAPDSNGDVTFQYYVLDTQGARSEAQSFTLSVNAVNDAPRDISLSGNEVEENVKPGTAIGTLSATDPDDTHLVYSFAANGDAEGRFDLVTKNGITTLVVKAGTNLDYEQTQSFTVIIHVSDPSGATYKKELMIRVGNIVGETFMGAASSEVMKGDVGRDIFSGNDGDDHLWGSLGNDTLTGGKGKDVFVFDTRPNKSQNKDTIVDFKVKDDSIWLDNKVFAKLGKAGSEAAPAQLKKAFFTIGPKAKDKNDYLVYDNKKGVLFYDADGSGKGKAVEIATLSKKLHMTNKDFFVI